MPLVAETERAYANEEYAKALVDWFNQRPIKIEDTELAIDQLIQSKKVDRSSVILCLGNNFIQSPGISSIDSYLKYLTELTR